MDRTRARRLPATMRHHPISPVTEPMQYRAIGVVRGTYVPSDPDQLTRGTIQTEDGTAIEAVVLGRVLTLMRRHLDLSKPHLWVAYPRYREADQLHLQLVGVWEPSTLAATAIATEPAAAPAEEASGESSPSAEPAAMDLAGDDLPEGDDYFSVRGELIYTRPESGDLVVKVRQMPRPDGSRPVPFKLQLKGDLPLEHLRHFVALDLRRQGQQLCLDRFEVLEPVAQRGNRGGKGRPPATEHLIEQRLPLATGEVAAKHLVVEAVSEALLAEVVGDPLLGELLHAALDGAHLQRVDATDADDEPVAAQVAAAAGEIVSGRELRADLVTLVLDLSARCAMQSDDAVILIARVQSIGKRRTNAATCANYHCGTFRHLNFPLDRSTGIHATALCQLHRRWQGPIHDVNRSTRQYIYNPGELNEAGFKICPCTFIVRSNRCACFCAV